MGCGICCSRFKITLRAYEYALITENFGWTVIWIDDLGNACLRKVEGGCVFQGWDGSCKLQLLGMKPLVCKVWPFTVHREPQLSFTSDASFRYRGEEYFVYVDTLYPCSGVDRGEPEELSPTVAEAVEISLDPEKPQRYTTAIRRVKPTLQV